MPVEVLVGKYYEYKSIVTIADTNLYQHMDFRNYFDLQGVVRGLWVKDAVVDGMESLMNSVFLITKSDELVKSRFSADIVAITY